MDVLTLPKIFLIASQSVDAKKRNKKEKLRCRAVVKTNLRSLITGWSDGKIRAFLPQSGRLMCASLPVPLPFSTR